MTRRCLQACTSAAGQHVGCCSATSRRKASTPYSSPSRLLASLTPSVYRTTVSPGDKTALTTSTFSSEKKPSGLQLLSNAVTPDLPANNTVSYTHLTLPTKRIV